MSIDLAALKAAHRLEGIVSEHVTLSPDGSGRLKGRCPFHADRTPSFCVYLDQQTFHCFGAGCQAHGDVITFLQRVHGWTFLQAVNYLIARAPDTSAIHPPPRRAAPAETDAKQAALTVAMAIYHRDIRSRWAPQARDWLRRRGLLPDGSERLIDECHLGYCSGHQGEAIIAALRKKAIPIQAARDVGILSRSGTYEPFAQRLIIPEIRKGVVVWLTGRLVCDRSPSANGQRPRKYLNVRGPRALLGAERIMGQREVVLVESPLDYLTLVLWRYPAAAMEGGTIPQADQTRFTSEKIYLPHNRDEAGWAATERLARQFGERAYSIFLPASVYGQPIKDVNDLADKTHNPYLGAQIFRQCGQRAVPYDPALWAGAYGD